MRLAIGIVSGVKVAVELISALLDGSVFPNQIAMVTQQSQDIPVAVTDEVVLRKIDEFKDSVLLVPRYSAINLGMRNNTGILWESDAYRELDKHEHDGEKTLLHHHLQKGRTLVILRLSGTEQQELIQNRLILSYAIKRFQLVDLRIETEQESRL